MATDLDAIAARIATERAETAQAVADLNGARAAPSGDQLVIRSLADVEPRAIDWLWHRWLARGKFHLLAGQIGDGKGILAAAIAALGSKAGGRWPDGSTAPMFRTLFVLGEDAMDDTLRPRFDLHGGDPAAVMGIETVLDARGRERFFNIERHLDLLDDAIVEHTPDLLVIDPLTTIMPGKDRNAEGDTRDSLTPLLKLGERRHVAIVGIVHLGKPTGVHRVAVQRILGATAFGALARVVWMTAPAEDGNMALGVVKSNLAMKPQPLLWTRTEDGPIVWAGTSAKSIDDLLRGAPLDRPRDRAEGFLREMLGGGAKPVQELMAVTKAVGMSWSTVRRAAEEIGITKQKEATPNGRWFWSLPDDPEEKVLTSQPGEQVRLIEDAHSLSTHK